MGTHFERGQALFALKRFNEAIVAYEQELGVNPQSVASHSNIAASLVNLERKQAAREAAGRALQISPSDAHSHYVLSYVEPDVKQAESQIREALRVDPTARYFCRLGEVLRRAGRHRDCLEATDEALRLDAKHTEALVLRARALESLGRLDEAADVLRSAREISPQDPEVQHALGTVVLASGDPAEALEALREARRISPVKHHSRDKIFDAYARRMPPFRQIEALARRYRRLSLVKQWTVAALGTTAILILYVATRSPSGRPPVATVMVYILCANAAMFAWSARQYAKIATRFLARRELDRTRRQVFGESYRSAFRLTLGHALVTFLGVVMSAAPSLAFTMCAAILTAGLVQTLARILGKSVDASILLLPAALLIGLSIHYDELLKTERDFPAIMWWGAVLLLTGVCTALFQGIEARTSAD